MSTRPLIDWTILLFFSDRITATSRLSSLLNIFTTVHTAVVVVELVVDEEDGAMLLVEPGVVLVAGAIVVLVVPGRVVVVLATDVDVLL